MNTKYNKYIIWILILATGFLIGSNYKSLHSTEGVNTVNHEMPKGAMNNMSDMNMTSTSTHMHMEQDVSSLSKIPSIYIAARKDSVSGYNIKMNLNNFTFTPENIGGSNVDNQGHAHVYVNGVKLGRSYADFYHIPSDKLKQGSNEIEVTLNANDHSDLIANGKHLSAKIMLEN